MFSKAILNNSIYNLISKLILNEFNSIYKGIAINTFLRFGLSIIFKVILKVVLRFILKLILRIILRIILSLIISLIISLTLSFKI
jgi:hypothetical protein